MHLRKIKESAYEVEIGPEQALAKGGAHFRIAAAVEFDFWRSRLFQEKN